MVFHEIYFLNIFRGIWKLGNLLFILGVHAIDTEMSNSIEYAKN